MIKWNSVKDRLPEHHQTVLAATKTGQAVSIFIDAAIMLETLERRGLPHSGETSKYYFCSQETKQHTLNDVTHWQPLPEPPL